MVGKVPFGEDGEDTSVTIPAPLIAVTVDLRNFDGSLRFINGKPLVSSTAAFVTPIMNLPMFQMALAAASFSPTITRSAPPCSLRPSATRPSDKRKRPTKSVPPILQRSCFKTRSFIRTATRPTAALSDLTPTIPRPVAPAVSDTLANPAHLRHE